MKAPGLIAILSIAVLIASEHGAYAQGVMIQDASTASMLPLGSSHINVVINDQVALVTSAQSFINDQSDTLTVKYGYPLAVTASATRVRWMLADSVWHTASMVAEPQDTILPGTGGGASVDPLLQGYLGETPLYFNINNPIPPGAWMVVEISYVELLPYGNARVEFSSASDYSQLFSQPLLELSIDVSLLSQRSITGMDISGTGNWSPQAASVYVSNDSASLHIAEPNVPASCGFIIGYDLDPSAYGITSMSNFLPDSLVKCDQLGNGFFRSSDRTGTHERGCYEGLRDRHRQIRQYVGHQDPGGPGRGNLHGKQLETSGCLQCGRLRRVTHFMERRPATVHGQQHVIGAFMDRPDQRGWRNKHQRCAHHGDPGL
jgi:hypothetical protein